ncbi:circularly permuted type 2 ATP-grasp protein [Desulfurispirillum indicum]|uniref:circularly permuted type 2 ATP-grasp protein n=1 Tax=Desulfurispirillum indicum TaxID=936456 RepID=UPI001CFBA9C3|nr:circularly permuted type 2 ATP-grasp protein [Desulfurispirillum indicum]UCZ57082.1 circularly permuted type 2 ATP-grasp protein [Desulfurispirillum indicum]
MEQAPEIPPRLRGYLRNSTSYDEMWTQDGTIQPHWQQFMKYITAMEPAEIGHTQQEMQQLLRENGVTYSTFHDEGSHSRPWQLDMIPLLIEGEEWLTVEAGLLQRACLLDMIMADLYGPRKLIREGLLPLELIYGHSGFLRPCDQVAAAGSRNIVLYAADLARGPDNRIWVLNDRTQAPSGLGYALENRMIMSRIMPWLMRSCQTHRLASFFRVLRETLSKLAPQQREFPRIVLLSPGARDEMYFEHAYLATYLGYTLVQGDDLTVRDGRVWLKSIDGLLQVDIILRRVMDTQCDPLELDKNSYLGVPGLLEAVRRGNVTVVNPVGCAVMENPGLMAFLPAIARYYLNEDLILPMVATWWCGQEREKQHVLTNIDKLAIISTLHDPKGQIVYGPLLSKRELENLKARIKMTPYAFSGREIVQFSTAPSLTGDQLEPRRAFMRSFLVAGDQGYTVMRGGLARSVPEQTKKEIRNGGNPITKDTWILSSKPQEHISLWKQESLESLIRQQSSLPSRTAENLYWVGRYAERVETTARLLRTTLSSLADRDSYSDDATENASLRALLQTTTQLTGTLPGFVGDDALERLQKPEEELLSIIIDPKRVGSLSSSINAFLRGAFSVRERWSFDTWRIINDMEEHWKKAYRKNSNNIFRLHTELNQLITSMVAFTGLTMESMTREAGWRMLDMGRRIERALLLITLFRATVSASHEARVEYVLLEALLATCESLITYRRRYRSALHLEGVLELALLDEVNPRSLAYQIITLRQHVDQLPRQRIPSRLDEDERLILDVSTALKLAQASELSRVSLDGTMHTELEELLIHLESSLEKLSVVINRTFFRHAADRRQLVKTLLEVEL